MVEEARAVRERVLADLARRRALDAGPARRAPGRTRAAARRVPRREADPRRRDHCARRCGGQGPRRRWHRDRTRARGRYRLLARCRPTPMPVAPRSIPGAGSSGSTTTADESGVAEPELPTPEESPASDDRGRRAVRPAQGRADRTEGRGGSCRRTRPGTRTRGHPGCTRRNRRRPPRRIDATEAVDETAVEAAEVDLAAVEVAAVQPGPSRVVVPPVAGEVPPELAARDEAVAKVRSALGRRAKRALQDEQNELLDALRKAKGRPTPDGVLPPVDGQSETWADVLAPAVDEVYRAATRATSADARDRRCAARVSRRDRRRAGRSPPGTLDLGVRRRQRRRGGRRRPASRFPLPRMAHAGTRQRTRRCVGGRLGAGNDRRRARRCAASLGDSCRWVLPRLRRRRPGGHAERSRVPDRSARAAGARRLSLRDRGRDHVDLVRQCEERYPVIRQIGVPTPAGTALVGPSGPRAGFDSPAL